MLVKNGLILLVFSSPSACCTIDGYPIICLKLLYLGHSSVIYGQLVVASQSSLVMRYTDGLSWCVQCKFLRKICAWMSVERISVGLLMFWFLWVWLFLVSPTTFFGFLPRFLLEVWVWTLWGSAMSRLFLKSYFRELMSWRYEIVKFE